MPRYEFAHIRRTNTLGQPVDLIIIPLESSFGYKTEQEKAQIIAELQLRANSTGWAGTAIPVWENQSGGMSFIAPQRWHPFLDSIDLGFVMANVNRYFQW